MARRIGNENERAPQSTLGTFLWSIVRGMSCSAAVAICGAVLVSLVQLIGGWNIEVAGIFQVFSYLSMGTGGFMAAKSYQRNGWLIGGLVGVLFILAMNFATTGSLVLSELSRDATFRLGLGFITGAIGGVLGVNL